MSRGILEFLKQDKDNVLIPCENKRPLYSHKASAKSSKWTYDKSVNYTDWHNHDIGILLKTLIVLDFDSKQTAQEWEDKFEILKDVPMETTKKGAHYYFYRTPLCDEKEIYDKSRAIYIDNIQIDIDIKTICSTGTAGLCICGPSKNKQWIRPIWNTYIYTIPDELTEYIAMLMCKPTSASSSILCKQIPHAIDDIIVSQCNELLKTSVNDHFSYFDQQCNGNLYYKTNQVRICPYGIQHTSNNFFLNLSQNGKVWYKCPSKECINRPQVCIGTYKPKNIADIIEYPMTDVPYAQLFLDYFQDNIVYDEEFYVFNGIRWIEKDKHEMYRVVSDSLIKLLDELDSDEVKELKKAKENVRKHRYLINILDRMKMMIYKENFRHKLDTKENLIGFNNGIYDLYKREFREYGKPEELVSKSTGYDYFDDINIFDENEYNSFICFVTRIYPIVDEKSYVQKWYGYCLYGRAPEKYICILTDMRSGYNGKTKMMQAVMKSMGSDYARVIRKDILYKSDKTEKNGHDANILDLKGLRLGVCEELDPTKRLDEQWIKDSTGGGATVTARGLYEKKPINFDIITKIVVTMNQKNMPKWNDEDYALRKRIIVIPHRSKFVDKNTLSCTEEEYTYEMEDIEQKLIQWRPYMMKWLIEGYQRYVDEKLDNKPAGCDEYLNKMIEDGDEIKDYIENNLFYTGKETDFVKMEEIIESLKKFGIKESLKRMKEKIKKQLGEPVRIKNFRNVYKGYSYC